MRRFAVLGLVLCIGGCSDKVAESLLLLRHRVDEVHRKLDFYASQSSTELARGQIDSRPFDPPLHVTGALSGNAVILSFDAVAEHKPTGELGFRDPISELAHRLDRSNDAENVAALRRKTSHLPADVAAAEGIRYLVLYRLPRLQSPEENAPGMADVEIFVHDLTSQGSPRRYQRILALTPAGGSHQELLATAHDQLIDAVVSATGGRVDIDRRLVPVLGSMTGLMENDPTAAKSVAAGGSPEARVAANLRQARALIAKHENPVNVCHTVFLAVTLEKLPPALVKEAHDVCGSYEK